MFYFGCKYTKPAAFPAKINHDNTEKRTKAKSVSGASRIFAGF